MDTSEVNIERSRSFRLIGILGWLPIVIPMLWLGGTRDPLKESALWPFEFNSAVVPFLLGTAIFWAIYGWLRAKPTFRREEFLVAGVVNGLVVSAYYSVVADPGGEIYHRLPEMTVAGIATGLICSQIIRAVLASDRARHGPNTSLERTRER